MKPSLDRQVEPRQAIDARTLLTSRRLEANVYGLSLGGLDVEGKRQLTLAIDGGPDTDAREVSDLTGELRRRLLELDVDQVELIRAQDVPGGAKPGDAISIGALAVTLTPTAVTAVIALLKSWLRNRPVRSAKVTIEGDSIEISHLSAAAEERLLEVFLERHAKR